MVYSGSSSLVPRQHAHSALPITPDPPSLQLRHQQAVKDVTELVNHLKSTSDLETWMIDTVKRHVGASHLSAQELRKIGVKLPGNGDSQCVSSLRAALTCSYPESGVPIYVKLRLSSIARALQTDLAEQAADLEGLVAFLRGQVHTPLERSAKAREAKLKKVRLTILSGL